MPSPDTSSYSEYWYTFNQKRANQISAAADSYFTTDPLDAKNNGEWIGSWFEWAGYSLLTYFLHESEFLAELLALPYQIGLYPQASHEVIITNPRQTRSLNKLINLPNEPWTTPDGYIFDTYTPNQDLFVRLLGVIEYSAGDIALNEKAARLERLTKLLTHRQTSEKITDFFAAVVPDTANFKPLFISEPHLFALSFSNQTPRYQKRLSRFPIHLAHIEMPLPKAVRHAQAVKRNVAKQPKPSSSS